jgi:hypothetical protein
LQETNTKGPAIGPSSLGLKVAKHPLGVLAAVLGNDQQTNIDGDYTSKGPENGKRLEM